MQSSLDLMRWAVALRDGDKEDAVRELHSNDSASWSPSAQKLADAYEIAAKVQNRVDLAREFLTAKSDFRESMYELIDMYMAVHHLKDCRRYRSTLVTGCRLLLPPADADIMASIVGDKSKFKLAADNSSLISRLRFRLDFAYMQFMRRKFKHWLSPEDGGAVIYAMVDASPQGGRDYEMLLVNVVRRADLRDLQSAISTLDAMAAMGVCDGRLDDNMIADEQEMMSIIKGMIHRHIFPPVVLGVGKGRSTLSLRFSKVLHALFLETGSLSLCSELYKSIPSWLTDYGTEVGFGRVSTIEAAQCLPWHADAVESVDDVEGGAEMG